MHSLLHNAMFPCRDRIFFFFFPTDQRLNLNFILCEYVQIMSLIHRSVGHTKLTNRFNYICYFLFTIPQINMQNRKPFSKFKLYVSWQNVLKMLCIKIETLCVRDISVGRNS